MKTALITGANKGIGLATAEQLAKNGIYVYLGCRNLDRGRDAVRILKDTGLQNITAIEIDVTNPATIASAANFIKQDRGRLDILINNAGISGIIPQSAASSATEDFRTVFEVNFYGVINTTQRFLELLLLSPEPRVVNVSTSVGSLSLQSNPEWPAYSYAKYAVYASSKAAMNMYTLQLAYEMRDTNLKVNAVCPGYTKTDFTNHIGGDVEVAAGRIAKYALIGQDVPSGKFISEETNPQGGEIPW